MKQVPTIKQLAKNDSYFYDYLLNYLKRRDFEIKDIKELKKLCRQVDNINLSAV